MSEFSIRWIESVDSLAVGSYPYVIGPVVLIKAQYSRIAQTGSQSDMTVGIGHHAAFADSDESLPYASRPDVAVLIGIDALDRMCRKGRRVSGYMRFPMSQDL